MEHPIASTPALAHLGLVGGADSGYLLRHSASGISPLPILIWLAFPEYGGMDCYQIGMVRQFIIERVQPKDFNEVEHTTTEKCLNPTTTCARVALIRVVVHLNSAATALV